LPGPGGLVLGDEDDTILNCYWLARWYHQSPEHFLSMRVSDVRLHMVRTAQMIERMQQERDGND
jgi:hypothetical protein